METWKQIDSYDGYYVSSFGKVYSSKSKKYLTSKIRSKTSDYYYVNLYKNGTAQKHNVHRLVALTFLHRPKEEYVVNHKDGNKHNNCVDNLEWVTRSQNDLHAFDMGLRKSNAQQIQKAIDSTRKPIVNLTTGEKFNSVIECAKKYNIKSNGISKCLRGKRKRYYGMQFSYLDTGKENRYGK